MAHRIYSRGKMLRVDRVAVKASEYSCGKAELCAHSVLFDIDDRKALFTRNAGYDLLTLMCVRIGNDESARILGVIRVSYIDSYAFLLHGEDGILVKHARAHIGKLSQLSVGYGGDGKWRVNYSWVRHKKARNIRPVLIKICACSPCDDRARYIRAAARKCLYRAVGH